MIRSNKKISSGVYGPAQSRGKEPFWNSLVQMNNVIDIPWCIVGDFNELETLSEKKGEGQSLLEEQNTLKFRIFDSRRIHYY